MLVLGRYLAGRNNDNLDVFKVMFTFYEKWTHLKMYVLLYMVIAHGLVSFFGG